VKTIGRSLPRLVLATIASLATCHHVSVFSDRAETRQGLLTGGVLVRIQPEEPFFSTICGRRIFRLIFTLPFFEPISCGFFCCGPQKLDPGKTME
jgi:hypothetical protein